MNTSWPTPTTPPSFTAQRRSTCFPTIRLYVGLWILFVGWMPCAGFDTARAEAASPDWASRITPLVRRPEAGIRPLNLNYEVSWGQWLQAGSLHITFDPEQGGADGPIRATARAHSLGPVQVLWPYESLTRAEIRRQTLHPARFEHEQTTRDKRETYRAIDLDGSLTIESTRESGSEQTVERETRTHELARIRDFLSMLLFLQQFDLNQASQGQPITLLVQSFKHLYLISFRMLGREPRTVFDTTRQTIKFAVEIDRVKDDLSLARNAKMRSVTLWLDDTDRIPVEIQADLLVGHAAIRLIRSD